MNQLRMVRPSSLGPVCVPPLARDYAVRQFRNGDQRAYEDLFHLAFEDEDRFHEIHGETLPGGYFLVEHVPSRRLASSCLAMRGDGRGQLGWLVTGPAHARKGLGTHVAALVTNRLLDFAEPFPGTDDFRLAGIGIYLRLGWQPLLYAEEMPARWSAIRGQLVKLR